MLTIFLNLSHLLIFFNTKSLSYIIFAFIISFAVILAKLVEW